MGGEIEVIQDVGVLEVTETGTVLQVDIFGGARNVCGTVEFTFTDPAERASMRSQLDRWQRRGTPLTYVSCGATISLRNDEALHRSISGQGSIA